jgi:hypothetical protein
VFQDDRVPIVEYHDALPGHAGREDLVAMGTAVRATNRQGRSFALSGWEEDGSTVSWRLSARLPGMGADGGHAIQESAVTAVFGADGLVREVWSRDAGQP